MPPGGNPTAVNKYIIYYSPEHSVLELPQLIFFERWETKFNIHTQHHVKFHTGPTLNLYQAEFNVTKFLKSSSSLHDVRSR